MCGFVGVWSKTGVLPSLDIGGASATFAHRGPDDASHADFGHVALGFRRLQIIDLSERGRQPMLNEDGSIALVFNGEIYNYKALREELIAKGHTFRSDSDTEAILHLYEEEGEACVSKLRGMFAFVIYDRTRDLLFGARDRFGIKPLFYTETDGLLALASESKAFLELPGFEPRVNVAAIPHYLTFQYVPEPETMLAGVYKVPPAHSFVWRDGSLSVTRYWQPEFKPREDLALEELLEGTREVMREAVRLHTQADVPWGAFLSGGIDSTIIVALLRELGPVSTFSVGYEEHEYSELDAARESARYLETDHHEYRIAPGEFWEHLPRLVWHFDDPVADPSAISLYFVARMARKEITVTLSGEGADEVFGGYGIYHEPVSLRPVSWLPRPLLKGAHTLWPGVLPGKNYLRRAATPIEERYFGNAMIFTEAEKRALLKRDDFPAATSVTAPYYREAAGYDDVQKMQYIDLHTWMPGDILVKADKMTMANSLELRVPYLDHHVFEFAATLPTKYKVGGGMTKTTLRKAFADIVPPAAVNRPKWGFPVPTRVWMRGPLADEIAALLDDPALDEFFDRSVIRTLIDDHRSGRADNSRKIWALVIFALWHAQFIRGGRGR